MEKFWFTKKFWFVFLAEVAKYIPNPIGNEIRVRIMKKFFKRLGKNVVICEGVVFKHPENIEIGDNVSLNEFCYLHGIGGLKIGNNVRIAPYVCIYTHNHKFDDRSKLIVEQGLEKKPVVIEDDCWIGSNVIILAGVKIGKGSVIGAGSVVTKDIPPYSVAVGVPAKVIRKRGERASEDMHNFAGKQL